MTTKLWTGNGESYIFAQRRNFNWNGASHYCRVTVKHKAVNFRLVGVVITMVVKCDMGQWLRAVDFQLGGLALYADQ
jgi:hypothetical protein